MMIIMPQVKTVKVLFLIFLTLWNHRTAHANWNEKSVQRGTGIKLNSATTKNGTGSRGSGLKLNFAGRSGGRSTTSSPDYYNSTIGTNSPPIIVNNASAKNLNVGLVVPYKSFGYREYTKAITLAKAGLQRKLVGFRNYELTVHLSMKELTPSPTGKYIFSFFTYFTIREDDSLLHCLNK